MKNQFGTIKTNLELDRVVMGGSGGYRRLSGGSDHFRYKQNCIIIYIYHHDLSLLSGDLVGWWPAQQRRPPPPGRPACFFSFSIFQMACFLCMRHFSNDLFTVHRCKNYECRPQSQFIYRWFTWKILKSWSQTHDDNVNVEVDVNVNPIQPSTFWTFWHPEGGRSALFLSSWRESLAKKWAWN